MSRGTMHWVVIACGGSYPTDVGMVTKPRSLVAARMLAKNLAKQRLFTHVAIVLVDA